MSCLHLCHRYVSCFRLALSGPWFISSSGPSCSSSPCTLSPWCAGSAWPSCWLASPSTSWGSTGTISRSALTHSLVSQFTVTFKNLSKTERHWLWLFPHCFYLLYIGFPSNYLHQGGYVTAGIGCLSVFWPNDSKIYEQVLMKWTNEENFGDVSTLPNGFSP